MAAEQRIDLLRHGEAEGGACFRGRTDHPLTGRGWLQLWSAIPADPEWTQIVTSPSQRCAAFAKRLAERFALPLCFDDDLREVDFGLWEGVPVSTVWQQDRIRLEQFWADPLQHAPPEGESITDLAMRVGTAWQRLLLQPGATLVITHGGPLRLLVASSIGLPLNRLMHLETPPACSSRVRVSRDEAGRPYPSLVFHAGSFCRCSRY